MPLTVDGSGEISVMYSPITRDEFGNYYYGTMASFNCSSGFSLSGPRKRKCVGVGDSTTGQFNSESPTCLCELPHESFKTVIFSLRRCFTQHWSIHSSIYTVITCSALSVDNGMIMYSSDTTAPYDFETTATHQCIEGFSLVGGDEVRTCTGDGSSSNGSWSGQPPACSGI